MEEIPSTKICTRCHRELPMECFDYQKLGKYGKRADCKDCVSLRNKEYKLKNPDAWKVLYVNYRNSLEGFIKCCFHDVRARSIKRKFDFDLTKEFVQELWNKQNGKCALTGLPLEYARAAGNGRVKKPYQGSLDRVDSSKGYTKDNVRWICWFANLMKSNYSDEELLHFCRLVVNGPKLD